MILNASHEITLRGMPPDIQEAYVRYKKGSRAILSWLLQFGPSQYKRTKKVPIKGLALLAKAVIHSIKELPDVIHFHFKETIAARKRLSKYFRTSIDGEDDNPVTVNHEHFTSSLAEIYLELCQHCRDGSKKRKSAVLCSDTLPEEIKNHYACLPIEDSLDALELENEESTCEECCHEPTYHCSGSHFEVELERDEMDVAIETASDLERIHETLSAIEACWRQAAQGHEQAHFVAAAGATNVAWAAIREIEIRLRNSDETLSISALHRRCCIFTKSAGEPDGALSKVHALLDALSEADRAITHYLHRHKLTVIANCPSCVQKPSDFIQSPASSQGEQKKCFPEAVMDNILHLVCGPRQRAINFFGSPVFAEIGHLLIHPENNTTSFCCILGLHLLLTTYQTYINTLAKPTTLPLCRIKALKLSRQAVTSLDKILDDKDSFPCRCTETLAFHLANLREEMDFYSKYKSWDLYSQSPWVAGNQIIEMLDMLSYYGMRLFNYRHYIGAVLHSYNVLIQHGGLDKIPILEEICDTFKEVFFPSGRPTSHFKNSWARYIGARLKFKKGHKRHGTDGQSWCMAVPAHAARNAAGLGINKQDRSQVIEPKFDYSRIDPLMKLKQQDWRVDLSTPTPTSPFSEGEQFSRRSSSVSTSASTSRPATSSSNTTVLSTSTAPTSPSLTSSSVISSLSNTTQPLSTAHSTLLSALPTTTTLNHTILFSLCTNIIRSATLSFHTEAERADRTATPLCICFSSTLLAGADRIVEGRKFGGLECWKKSERDVVEVLGKLVRDGFEQCEGLRWEV